MPIFSCSNSECNRLLAAGVDRAGTQFKCPCGHTTRVPGFAPKPAPVPAYHPPPPPDAAFEDEEEEEYQEEFFDQEPVEPELPEPEPVKKVVIKRAVEETFVEEEYVEEEDEEEEEEEPLADAGRRAGRMVILAYVVAVLLLAYGIAVFKITGWRSFWISTTLTFLVPLILFSWARPFAWLIDFIRLIDDAIQANKAKGEIFRNEERRAQWEADMHAQLDVERQHQLERMRREIEADAVARRTDRLAQVEAEAAEWGVQERERLELECEERISIMEGEWQRRKREEVDAAVLAARREADMAVRQSMEQWEQQERAARTRKLEEESRRESSKLETQRQQEHKREEDRLGRKRAEDDARKRREAEADLDRKRKEVEAECESMKQKVVCGTDWLAVCDEPCELCKNSFANRAAIYACPCHAHYCSVCVETLMTDEWGGQVRCNGGPAAKHADKIDGLRKIQCRDPNQKRPAQQAKKLALGSQRGASSASIPVAATTRGGIRITNRRRETPA